MSAAVAVGPFACSGSVHVAKLDVATATDRELNFVRGPWSASVRESRPAAQTTEAFWRTHPRFVDRTIRRPSVDVWLAEDREDFPVGWLCAERVGGETVVHYAYVPLTFRRWGVASMLAAHLGPGPVIFTKWTPAVTAMNLAGKLPRGWTYDPDWVANPEMDQ